MREGNPRKERHRGEGPPNLHNTPPNLWLTSELHMGGGGSGSACIAKTEQRFQLLPPNKDEFGVGNQPSLLPTKTKINYFSEICNTIKFLQCIIHNGYNIRLVLKLLQFKRLKIAKIAITSAPT